MELTDRQKKNLEFIKGKVKTLSQIEKVKKELVIIARQKEKLEEKLATLIDSLNEDTSEEEEKRKKDQAERQKSKKESKDQYNQGSDNLLG